MANINLTPIFQAILALLAALITHRLIPWIVARTTNEQQAGIRALVKTLVFAAEQIYGAGKGAEKLAWVKYKLNEAGFDIDAAEIEAAVSEYLNWPPTEALPVYSAVEHVYEPPDLPPEMRDDGK